MRSDIAGQVLLCSLHRPDDWPRWIAAAELRGVDGNGGLKFENSSFAYQTAIDRLGIVMAQRALIADDLAAGRLVAPFDLEVETEGAYMLVHPPRSAGLATVRMFADWIIAEARPFQIRWARHPAGLRSRRSCASRIVLTEAATTTSSSVTDMMTWVFCSPMAVINR
jgi:DNA-binding transcriptional LysR family regulator